MPKKRPTKSAITGRPKDAAKREDIIAAASALFMTKGYELTSMEAVAKKADVSKLTIYSHFADKNELFKEVIRVRCDKMAMPNMFTAMTNEAVRPSLTKLADNFVKMIYHPDSIRMHRIMQAEALRHPKVVQSFYEAGPKRVRAAFVALLKEWVRQGKLAIPDAQKATIQFFSLLKGEALMRVILGCGDIPTPRELDIHVKDTIDLFLTAYHPQHK